MGTPAQQDTNFGEGHSGAPPKFKPVVSAVQDPNGNWIAPGIQIRKDYDASTGQYTWQNKNTPVSYTYELETPAGMEDGKWGVDPRTGFAVPWTDRGTVEVNGVSKPAQWNKDMTIMSPEQYRRYYAYGAQTPGSADFKGYYPSEYIHHSNAHIRDRARHFALTGEYLEIDPTKLYDRDAYYRGDASAVSQFNDLAAYYGYGEFAENPFSHQDRQGDPLYMQMFFDNNKRQLYNLASNRAQRWLAMNGLTQSRNWDYKSSPDAYAGSMYARRTQQIIDAIPGYNNMTIAQKMTALRAMYDSIAQAQGTDSQNMAYTDPTRAPYISMMYHRLSLEHQNTLASPGHSSSTPSSSYSITGNYIDPSIPKKDRGLWYYWQTAWGYQPGYDSQYVYAIFRPTDRVQIDTANHFGLLGKDEHGYYVLPQEEIANNFVNNNKWFWDPDEYLKHISWLQQKGQQDAARNTNWHIFYNTPGAYTQSQHGMAGSSAAPTWMASNPLFTNINAAYIRGVGDTIRQNHSLNERNLGIASHISGSLMRSGINFFTLGTGNHAADKLFAYLNGGTTFEQNFANAVQHGADPSLLAAAGMGAELVPVILSAGVAAPASMPTLGRAPSVFTQLRNAKNMADIYRTVYMGNNALRTMQGVNQGLAAFQRGTAFQLPLGSPEQQALMAAGHGQNLSTVGLLFGGNSPFAQSLALNSGQFLEREIAYRDAIARGDTKAAEEIRTQQNADYLNALLFDPLFTWGLGNGGVIRRGLGMVSQGAAPFVTYDIADQQRKPVVNENIGFWERHTPEAWQRDGASVLRKVKRFFDEDADVSGIDSFILRKDLTDAYRIEAEASQLPGYNTPGNDNYWGARWFGHTAEDMAAIMSSPNNPLKKPDGTPYDPSKPEDVEAYTEAALKFQVFTGEVPASFYDSPQFKSLPLERKQAVLGKLIESQLTLKADPTKHANLIQMISQAKASGAIPDFDMLFTGEYKDDKSLDPIRQYVTHMVDSMTLPEILEVAGSSAQGSGNNWIRQRIEASPVLAEITLDRISTDTELQARLKTVFNNNPELLGRILQSDQFQQLNLAEVISQAGSQSDTASTGIIPFIADLAASNAQVREFVQGKIQALPTDTFMGILRLGIPQWSSDSSVQDQEESASTHVIPPIFRDMVEHDLQRRLNAGNQESDRLAYALIPYMRQCMERSANGPHVQPGTAKAFMAVMKRPEFWQQFDQRNMLSFCEYLVSSNGSQAFGALSDEERTQWVTDIQATCKPIIQQHMWNAFKAGDIETVRRFMALKHNFAKDPLMFYGTSAALILGGITVLGSLFSSDDDEDDEEEDEDDDAAYRKRIRKSLRQKEELDLNLDEDESD